MHYSPMTSNEIAVFSEMFSVFQDLILAMIRNAVKVLPKNTLYTDPDVKAHLKINSATKKYQSYSNFIDAKDIFLSCISNETRRSFFSKSILKFVANNNRKIKFFIKNSIYKQLDQKSKVSFKEDIKKLENIINKINDNFNIKLPEAKQQGKLLISKIREIEIPKKAKYNSQSNKRGI